MGRGRGTSPLSLTLCCGCGAVLITAIVLIAVSVKSLDANEVGLAVDGFSQSINTRLYTGGTYFLGPVYRFEKYPTTLETIAFSSVTANADGPSLAARTSDGLAITLQIGFNYQIRAAYDDVLALYLNYGSATDVDTLYQRIAKNVVRTVAANYPAASFFVSQETIRDAMSRQLATELATRRATLSGFNFLGAIGVPSALSSAITRQQNAQQDKTKAEQDLQTTRINAASRVDANRTAATLIVTGATNRASQLQQSVSAQVASLAARYAAERASYRAFKQALNMTVAELLSYVWLDAQAEASTKNSTSTVMALKRPAALTG